MITQLLKSEQTCFFVTAPRRMGKSMMLSMAHRLALGQWEAFPPGIDHWANDASDVAVIHLNFSKIVNLQAGIETASKSFLLYIVQQAKRQHDLTIDDDGTHPIESWVSALAQRQQRVVILVDEYDSFVNDAAFAVPDRISYAAELCERILKPFFKATKDVSDGGSLPQGVQLKVIVCGVSGVSLKSLASGANHFRHAIEKNPLWSALVGFTVDELKDTYGEQLVTSLQSLPGANAAADTDAAVQFVRNIGNGWCLDTDASIELFSPYVVTSWLASPKPSTEAERWTDTGRSQALTLLLKARAPELLEDRVVTVRDLREGRDVAKYYSPGNVAQLAFHYGYMSIKAGSRTHNAGDPPTVMLTVPNSAVRSDIERAVVQSATVDQSIADRLGAALRAFDFTEFKAGLNALVNDFCRAHKRPFANESELHSWGALWVTAVQRLTLSALWTVPEVLVALDSDSVRRKDRATPRIDSVFYWVDGDGKNCCVVIEWRIRKVQLQKERTDTTALDTFAREKLNQLDDREYVQRAREWMARQGMPVSPGCLKAAAAVYCWNEYGEGKYQHQCEVVELRS